MHTVHEPTLSELKRVLRYEPDSGALHWLDPNRPGRPNGSRDTRAGRMQGAERIIRAGGVDYLAAPIAWTFAHGTWPASRVYTLNGHPDDLRAENLTLERVPLATHVDAWTLLHRRMGQLNAARKALDLPPLPWSVASGQERPFAELVGAPGVDTKPGRTTVQQRRAEALRDFGRCDMRPPSAPAQPDNTDPW